MYCHTKNAIASVQPALFKSHVLRDSLVKYATHHPHQVVVPMPLPMFPQIFIDQSQWQHYNVHPNPAVMQQPFETGLKKISKKMSNFFIDTILNHKTAKDNWLVSKFMMKPTKTNILRSSPTKSPPLITRPHVDHKIFGNVNDLKTLENLASKNAAQKNGKFVCSACKSTFTRRYALKVHFR